MGENIGKTERQIKTTALYKDKDERLIVWYKLINPNQSDTMVSILFSYRPYRRIYTSYIFKIV